MQPQGKYPLLLLFSILSIVATAQTDSTRGVTITKPVVGTTAPKGKSYALIIGISKYQNFPSLNYADQDALAFYEFLRSKAGGGIDSSDMFIRLNENAKAGDIWRGVSWLEKRADTVGETAYIYFAGHGDAANASEAYLLANDAPNEGDPNLYNMGGTFQIYNLKAKIKKMTAKGVRVILITDACRTNELPGKENGAKWTFAGITEDRSGEIQMTSCASNEQSMEDQRWGHGRGVFSYYLVNGLFGLADNDPEDNEVTLSELEQYVKKNVRNDTKSLATNKSKQNPVFCCSEFSEMPLFKVDPNLKAIVAKNVAEGKGTFNSVATRSGITFSDSIQRTIYSKFLSAIKEQHLIYPQNASAVYYVDKLLNMVNDQNIRTDLQDHILTELINSAQTTINRYTHPPREDSLTEQNAAFFNESAEYLQNAIRYISDNPELKDEINAKRLFLEATAIAEGDSNADEINVGIAKADSSLKALRTSYVYNTLGLLFFKSNRYELAKQNFYTAKEMAKQWTYPLLNLGNIHRYLSDDDSALHYYRRALAIEPRNKNAFYNMGVDHYYTKNYDSALYNFRQAIAISKKYENAYNYMGITYINLKKPDSAKLYLKNLVTLNPNYEIAYYNLGIVYSSLKMYDSAIYFYKQTLRLYPTYYNAYTNMGLVYMDKMNDDSALYCFRKTLSLNPGDDYANNNIGLVLYDRKNYDSAMYYFKSAFNANPYLTVAAYNIGKTHLVKYNYDSALYYYQQALALDPKYDLAYHGIGVVYFETKKDELALGYFRRALQLNPELYTAPYNMAKLFSYAAQYDSSLYYYRWALAIKPDYDIAFNNIGNIYFDQAKYDSSLLYYRKTISVNPKFSSTLNNIGRIYYAWKSYDSAKLYYRKAIMSDAMYEYPWNNIGLIHEDLSNKDSALYYYKKAVSINPNYAGALLNAGNIYYDLYNYDSALVYYRRTITADPANEFANHNIGLIHYNKYSNDSAIVYFRRSMQVSPRLAASPYYLGVVYFYKYFDDSAIYYFKKAIALKPDHDNAYYYIGQTYYGQKKYDTATYYYRISLEINHKNYSSLYGLGSLYDVKYNSDSAIYYFKKSFDVYKSGETAYRIAKVNARMMNTAEVLQYLELAFQNGFKDFKKLESETLFSYLKNDDRFKALIAKYKKE